MSTPKSSIFPGVITFGKDLDQARRMLASALTDMADTNLQRGESLPVPDSNFSHPDADLQERIQLVLS